MIKVERIYLVVIPKPCREYSVLRQANILVLLHGLVQTMHPEIFQIHSIQKTLQTTIAHFLAFDG